MAILFPRLDAGTAYQLWEEYQGRTISELYENVTCSHPGQYYASTGGAQIDPDSIQDIGNAIREIAKELGYPDNQGQKELSSFDHLLAAWLYENLKIIDGEALRSEVWAFLTLCVVPDIVKWRFDGFHQSRLLGGRRNCLQRLWLRARAFDLGAKAKDRWALLKVMTEDAFVSIMERPSLSGNRNISRAIGILWYKTARKVGKQYMEAINRRAIRRLRAVSVLYLLDSLSRQSLKSIVAECYEEAAGTNAK